MAAIAATGWLLVAGWALPAGAAAPSCDPSPAQWTEALPSFLPNLSDEGLTLVSQTTLAEPFPKQGMTWLANARYAQADFGPVQVFVNLYAYRTPRLAAANERDATVLSSPLRELHEFAFTPSARRPAPNARLLYMVLRDGKGKPPSSELVWVLWSAGNLVTTVSIGAEAPYASVTNGTSSAFFSRTRRTLAKVALSAALLVASNEQPILAACATHNV